MLISKNWICDFVDVKNVDDKELATRFTLATAEVEGVEKTWGHLENIILAEIQSLKPHPEADKLNLVTVDLGNGKSKEVVCGAPNVRVGLKVPYAPLGTVLPGGFVLEPKKIRGILSEGMLCSEKELGLGEGSSGLMELNSHEGEVGESLLKTLSIVSDTLIDVDNKSLTHRPDLWGHHGQAREFAAAFDREFKNIYDDSWKESLEENLNDLKSPIIPKVISDKCSAYLGLSIDNIKVEKSPKWMIERLEAVGLRAINNMVDIGNYVMLELGIPLHIFDRDEIEGNLLIKDLEQGEDFVTLDEMNRTLETGDTVICDEKKTLVLAGIMGGLNSGVTEKTKNIFIEVANWKAASVRKTSSRLGLRTDSSQRYEKSLDDNLCYRTILRAMELVLELCPQAKIQGKVESYQIDQKVPLIIKTSASRISNVLGKKISTDTITKIFEALDFDLEFPGDDGFEVSIPSYRTTKDIECEADLIEEVGRMIGYDSIESIAPLMNVAPVKLSSQKQYERAIQDFLVAKTRSFEVMTYPLVGKSLIEKAQWSELNESLSLINALSVEQDRMRPSLIPSILEAISLNQKNFSDFSFFEMGRVYKEDQTDFSNEQTHLALVLFSKKENRFLELINEVEDLLNTLSVSFQFEEKDKASGKFKNELIPTDWLGTHPFEYLNIRIMGKFQGAMTSIHPLVLKNFKVKGNAAIALLNLSSFNGIEKKDKTKYKVINKLPKSSFDCSVLVAKDSFAASALDCVKKLKIKQLVDVKIVDVFSLDEKFNSVTLRSFFEDDNETMSPEFLKKSEDSIVDALSKGGFPLKM